MTFDPFLTAEERAIQTARTNLEKRRLRIQFPEISEGALNVYFATKRKNSLEFGLTAKDVELLEEAANIVAAEPVPVEEPMIAKTPLPAPLASLPTVKRKPGPRPVEKERVKAAMLKAGLSEVNETKEVSLAAQFKTSVDTVRKARKELNEKRGGN